jgi:hypothetical protein
MLKMFGHFEIIGFSKIRKKIDIISSYFIMPFFPASGQTVEFIFYLIKVKKNKKSATGFYRLYKIEVIK